MGKKNGMKRSIHSLKQKQECKTKLLLKIQERSCFPAQPFRGENLTAFIKLTNVCILKQYLCYMHNRLFIIGLDNIATMLVQVYTAIQFLR